MVIGGVLRAARLARKRSIEDVSRATKITPSVLRALENDQFEAVPGGLFTRGFLRAYAREVGVDGEELVRRFREEVEPPVTSPAPPAQTQMSDADDLSTDMGEPPAAAKHTQIIQFAVILVVAVGYLASLRQAKPSARIDAPVDAPVAIRADAVPVATPVATTGSTPPAPASLAVEIHATGPCWVQATADGERTVRRLMSAGTAETIDVRDNLTLRVGNPAAVTFSINGVAGRSIGRSGMPTTIRIDRSNYESFLDPPRRPETATDDRRPVADAARAAACCPRTP